MELNVWQIVVIAMFTATIIQGIYIYLQREAHMGLYVLVFLMTGFVLGVISTPT